jgi:hypothetical protein
LLLFAVPSAAVQLAMPVSTPDQLPEGGAWLLLIPVAMIAGLVGSIAISHLALRPGSSVGEGLQVGLRRFLPLFAASLLIGLAAMAIMVPLALILFGAAAATGGTPTPGSVVLFAVIIMVVGVAIWGRLALMTPIAAVEDAGPIEILKRSWNLTNGHFWKLLGGILILFIVGSIAVLAISAIVGIVVILLAGPPEQGSTTFILMTVFEALLSAVVSATLVILIARIYAQLTGSVPKDVFA